MIPIPASFLSPPALWPERTYRRPEHADMLRQAGHAPSDALRRELVDFCRNRIAVCERPREGECVAHSPRAPGPAGPGPGTLPRRELRERAARG
jgi:hypothetical protein